MAALYELALFAGVGGGILGGVLLGWRTVCAVEIEPYRREVLLRRQRDGLLPLFPIWDDIRTFDGRPWCGKVDIVTGGFPCQDISCSGRGAGIDGEKSGLWREMARVIGEVRPRFALVENTPMLTLRGLGRVLGDLASMGYDSEWGVLGADDAGAPHQRKRIWILASDPLQNRHGVESEQECECGGERAPDAGGDGEKESVADVVCQGLSWREEEENQRRKMSTGSSDGRNWWASESGLVRVVHGLAHRVDRIAALGDGQVPAVVALAWEILSR